MVENSSRQLRGKARRRFYEPIVLFKAFVDTATKKASSRASSLETSTKPQTEKEYFHHFSNRLCGVLDQQKGGGVTVTSLAVLESEDGDISFIFGCNQVNDEQRENMRRFMTNFLNLISGKEGFRLNDKERRKAILKRILMFQRLRIMIYMKELRENAEKCLENCRKGTDGHSGENAILVKAFSALIDTIDDLDFGNDVSDDCFGSQSLLALQGLRQFASQETGAYHLVHARASVDGVMGSSLHDCWAEVRHYVSRLLAYDGSVKSFLHAAAKWPELFESFEVLVIESSQAEPNPLGKRSEKAANIVGRMTSIQAEIQLLREHVAKLQMYELDERIHQQCISDRFRPIVHCEPLVLDRALLECTTRGLHFFNDWKYIGCSKPSCRLCKDYFTIHESGVKIRESSGNVYLNWRLPDMDEYKWRRIVNFIITNIRRDAIAIVEEKINPGKRHDSNTYYTEHIGDRPGETWTHNGSVGDEETDLEDLTSLLGQQLRITQTSRNQDLVVNISDSE